MQKDLLVGVLTELCEKSPWVGRQVMQIIKDGCESGLIESQPVKPNPVGEAETKVPLLGG